MSRQVSIKVYGRVQGVFFRASTKKKAEVLGVTGTVCNQADGTVFIKASGPGDKIQELIAWCSTGPPLARINKVEVNDDDSELVSGFEVSY